MVLRTAARTSPGVPNGRDSWLLMPAPEAEPVAVGILEPLHSVIDEIDSPAVLLSAEWAQAGERSRAR